MFFEKEKTLKLYDLGHAKTYHQDDQGSHSMHNVFMLKAKKKTFLQTLMWQGNLEKHYAWKCAGLSSSYINKLSDAFSGLSNLYSSH